MKKAKNFLQFERLTLKRLQNLWFQSLSRNLESAILIKMSGNLHFQIAYSHAHSELAV